MTFDGSLMERSNGSRVVIETFIFLSSLMIKIPLRSTKSIYTGESHWTLPGDFEPYGLRTRAPDNTAKKDVDFGNCFGFDVSLVQS